MIGFASITLITIIAFMTSRWIPIEWTTLLYAMIGLTQGTALILIKFESWKKESESWIIQPGRCHECWDRISQLNSLANELDSCQRTLSSERRHYEERFQAQRSLDPKPIVEKPTKAITATKSKEHWLEIDESH